MGMDVEFERERHPRHSAEAHGGGRRIVTQEPRRTVALYARVSTLDQNCDLQLADLPAVCRPALLMRPLERAARTIST
jgi:hypothetical protein